MPRRLAVLAAALVVAGALFGGIAPSALALPPRPAGWPARLELGLSDGPGGAARLMASASFGFRYQYLAGGVNTGQGWYGWNPRGSFVSRYVRESIRRHTTPVFSYYMLRQSRPGRDVGDEATADLGNLRDRATMKAWFIDFERFLGRARAFRRTPVVLHVEPDLWGHVERAGRGDDARHVRASVASTGLPELRGLPDTAAGFAQAVVRLRNRRAPNVSLGYHVSVWGTKGDPTYSKLTDHPIDALARRAGRFYRSLGARFDVLFTDTSDRDFGFKRVILGDGGASKWSSRDFYRHVRFIAGVVRATRRRMVVWQIPLGNTRMLAMNDTWGHFQDNRVQWLLDDSSRRHLGAYARAGVIAFLFGGGAEGTTCACDARNDGVTNPWPIDGNTGRSLSADDDGGFFRARVRGYYRRGALRLGR